MRATISGAAAGGADGDADGDADGCATGWSSPWLTASPCRTTIRRSALPTGPGADVVSPVPPPMWAGVSPPRPGPGADVVSPVPAPMWAGVSPVPARSRRRCGEHRPGPVPAPMW